MVSEAMRGTLMHVGSSLAIIAIIAVVLRVRRLPPGRFLALHRPPVRTLAGWVAAFAVLVAVEEIVSRRLGLPQPEPWAGRYTGGLLLLRILGLVVLAPLAEELVFRGVLFARICETRLGPAGAIVIPAAFFAILHVQYSALEMIFIAADGLFFGLARYRSRSLLVPIVLHALGNAFALGQRLLA
jgi:membrane protease YdiL (CAAX protease family)